MFVQPEVQVLVVRCWLVEALICMVVCHFGSISLQSSCCCLLILCAHAQFHNCNVQREERRRRPGSMLKKHSLWQHVVSL
jgi:hypothetical protein